MQPIQINVSVNIGVNPELHGLLTAILNRPQVEATDAVLTPRKQKVDKPTQVPENKPELPTSESETKTPGQETVTVTEVDVREAMDRTRRRIEGENYKEQTDSERYKKWHRQLTSFFKTAAAAFGSDKPSTLPDSESRAKFIAYCDAVYVEDDKLVWERRMHS